MLGRVQKYFLKYDFWCEKTEEEVELQAALLLRGPQAKGQL